MRTRPYSIFSICASASTLTNPISPSWTMPDTAAPWLESPIGRQRDDEACFPSCAALRKAPEHPMAATTPTCRPTRTCSASCSNAISGERFPDLCSGFSGSRSAHRPTPSSPWTIPKARRALPAASPAGRMICWRLGQMLVNGGASTARPNRLGALDQGHAHRTATRTPGRAAPRPISSRHGRYRNNWYQVGGGSNAFLAAGIHGQFLYCDPDTGTVIACTSSQHEPQTDGLDQALLAMFARALPGAVRHPYSNTMSGMARPPCARKFVQPGTHLGAISR
jgi:hypothetical protein